MPGIRKSPHAIRLYGSAVHESGKERVEPPALYCCGVTRGHGDLET